VNVSGVQKAAKAAVTHSPAAALHRMGHVSGAMDNRLVHLTPSRYFRPAFGRREQRIPGGSSYEQKTKT